LPVSRLRGARARNLAARAAQSPWQGRPAPGLRGRSPAAGRCAPQDRVRGSAGPVVPGGPGRVRARPPSPRHRARAGTAAPGRGGAPAHRPRVGPRGPRPSPLVPAHARALAAHVGRGPEQRGGARGGRMILRRPALLVARACVAPRLAVLLHERGAILAAFTEKSDDFARTFVNHGTFGFIPGEPSAWTQPLYAFFLIPIYWIFGRTWWAVGFIQIGVALVTALLVYEIGRRFVSQRAGLIAAVVATLNPYLVWHDVHLNREILDQLLAAAIVLLTLLVTERRNLRTAALLGLVLGLAILGNTRLLVLPLVVAAYVLWSTRQWQG